MRKHTSLAFPLFFIFGALAVLHHHAAPVAELATPTVVQVAGFPLGEIIGFLSNPAVYTLLAGLAVEVYRRISKNNASTDRWLYITGRALSILDELRRNGLRNWQELVPQVLHFIIEEIREHPGVESLSVAEVEKLQRYVSAMAKQRAGIVEKPMQEGPVLR